MNDASTVKAYRIIGWYGSIPRKHRDHTTLSDGAVYSSMELVNDHIKKYETDVLSIREITLPAGHPEIDHLLKR